MKKEILVLMLSLTLMLSIVLLFSGCSGAKDPLIGKWMRDGVALSYEFKDDGTIIEITDFFAKPVRAEGAYTTDGNRIKATMTVIIVEEKSLPTNIVWEWSYSIKKDKLTLVDLNLEGGTEITYTRE